MIEHQMKFQVDLIELKTKPITFKLTKVFDVNWSFELKKCCPYSMEVLVGYLKCKNIKKNTLKVNFLIKIKAKANIHHGRTFLEFSMNRPSSCVLSTRWKTIMESDELKNKKMDIFITLSFLDLKDDSDLNAFRYFGSELPMADVVFLINSQRIYCHRQFLALHSIYFKAMFYSNFKESKQFEIKLMDVDENEFLQMLQIIYPDQQNCDPIKYGNVQKLLVMADKFSIKTVMRKCEEFLLEDTMFPFMEKLKIAEKFGLSQLQVMLIQQMKKSHLKKLLQKSDHHDFSQETLVQILDRTKDLLY